VSLPFSFLGCNEFERNGRFSPSIKSLPKRGDKALRYMVLLGSNHISAENDNPSMPGPSSLFWLGIWWEYAMALDGTITRKQCSRKLADSCDRYRSANDARSLLDEILAPLNAGRVDARGTMLISRFVEEHYLPYERENCKPSTIAQTE
jgi:hypothetical protein